MVLKTKKLIVAENSEKKGPVKTSDEQKGEGRNGGKVTDISISVEGGFAVFVDADLDVVGLIIHWGVHNVNNGMLLKH